MANIFRKLPVRFEMKQPKKGDVKMKTTLTNAFGRPYEVDLRPMSELESVINSIDWGELAGDVWNEHCKGFDSVAMLNCETGEVEIHTYSGNSGDIEGAHLIPLYIIEANILGDASPDMDGDILDHKEFSQAKNLVDEGRAYSIEEAMKLLKISYIDRFGEWLADLAQEDSGDLRRKAMESLHMFYEKYR